jgi:hypothetical protein
MSTETPVYDQLAAESEWTPDQLRPPLDLDAWRSDSYMRGKARHHLLLMIAHRQKQKRNRKRPRTTPLP